ncbi:MAG: F0F1 ATP synthase subunit gamma, partial [Candidatus Omnitrophica bacterium]|nr:F0F1 ATP synthase subunit gamma [Candidatus Omnitrophota bacterium]
MATVTELKDELKFNRELTDLLEAMKNGAVFQFRALERQRERFEIFGKALDGFFGLIGSVGGERVGGLAGGRVVIPAKAGIQIGIDRDREGKIGINKDNPFVNPASDITGIIMITSDKGFMGGLNQRVISAALEQPGADKAELMIVGEKGAFYLKEMRKHFTKFDGIEFEKRHELAAEVKNYIMRGIREKRFGSVLISYPNPVSFMVQRVEIVSVLPLGER